MCLLKLLNFQLLDFQYCPFSASFLNTSIFTIPRQQIQMSLESTLLMARNSESATDLELIAVGG